MKKLISIILTVSLIIGVMCFTVGAQISNFGSSVVYSNNFWGAYVPGTTTLLTNATMNSVEVNNFQVRKDVENDFPVMISESGNGYAILKLQAIDGKVFHGGKIRVNGRTPAGTSIKFYAGTLATDVIYEAASFAGDSETSLTMHIPKEMDITQYLKGKTLIYLKVELMGGTGNSVSCLQDIRVTCEHQDDAQIVAFDNYDGYNVDVGQLKDLTAQELKTYKAENAAVGVVDLNGQGDLKRVLCNRGTTTSSVTYKFDAYSDKQFGNLYVNFHGRTGNYDNVSPASVRYYMSDNEATLNSSLIKEYTSEKDSLSFYSNKSLDLSSIAKGKSTVYVKVELVGKNDWVCLERIEFSATYQNVDTTIYSKDFKSFVAVPPTITTVTKENLGAVESENIKGNYMDNNNYYPIIYSPNGSGYFTLKLDADAGKVFEKLSLNYKGRAITIGSDICKLKFSVGENKNDITNVVKEYNGDFSSLNKLATLDLTNFAKDKPFVYLKVELSCPTGYNWAGLTFLEATAKSYSDNLCHSYITDLKGRPIYDLQASQDNVNVCVKLRPTLANNYVLIGAVYNKENGKMEQIKTFQPQSIVPGEMVLYTVDFDFTGKDKNKYILKGIVLDDFNTMIPIGENAVAQ